MVARVLNEVGSCEMYLSPADDSGGASANANAAEADGGPGTAGEEQKKEDAPTAPDSGSGRVRSEDSDAGSEFPPASFAFLLYDLRMRALMALGILVPPGESKPPKANLSHARFVIDLLGVIEEKTRGNLDAEEARAVRESLHELRMAFLDAQRRAR